MLLRVGREAMANSASAASSASPSPFESPEVRRSRASADCAAPASSLLVEGLLDRGCRQALTAACLDAVAATLEGVLAGMGVDVLEGLLLRLGTAAFTESDLPLEGPWLTLRAGKTFSVLIEVCRAGMLRLLCKMLCGSAGGSPGWTEGMGALGKKGCVELPRRNPAGTAQWVSVGKLRVSESEAATAAAVAASEAAALAKAAAAACLAAATAVAVVLLSWALAAARAERETCPDTVGQEPPPGGPLGGLGPGPAALVTANSTACDMRGVAGIRMMGADIKRAIASAGDGNRASTRVEQLPGPTGRDVAGGSMCAAIKGTLQFAARVPGGAVKAAAAAAAANAVNPEPLTPPPRVRLPEAAGAVPYCSVLIVGMVALLLRGSDG